MSNPVNGIAGDTAIPNEFVVDLADLDAVRAELGTLQPVANFSEISTGEASTVLGLALITVHNLTDVAAGMQIAVTPGSELPIEGVMNRIRQNCRSRGEPVPVMGKNRPLDGVHTTQHVGIGSARYPATIADWTPDLAGNGSAYEASVGILDTGLYPHWMLEGRYVKVEDEVLLTEEERRMYLAGHSTFVAGVVLQKAPDAVLGVRRALSAYDGTALAWDVAWEMVLLSRSVDVLNVSFVCHTKDNQPPLVLQRALDRMDPDTVVVSAAGNHGNTDPSKGPVAGASGTDPESASRQPSSPTAPMWPAAFERVVSVGSHDAAGCRSHFSPNAPWVTVTAPGEQVHSLYLNNKVIFDPHDEEYPPPPPPADVFAGFASWAGTSFAAPAVSGAIARRIGTGMTAQQALQEVLNLPPGNAEGIWRFQPDPE